MYIYHINIYAVCIHIHRKVCEVHIGFTHPNAANDCYADQIMLAEEFHLFPKKTFREQPAM